MAEPAYNRSERDAALAQVDREQRRAAAPQVSAWVAASAGTGKTKVLTDRVLRLLLAGAGPNEILCLTYTRAAAAEMSNRLYNRLAAWATLPVEAPGDEPSLMRELRKLGLDPREGDFRRARELFTLVLDCAGGMRIQTIHAFCQSVLARFPLEAGLPPGFTVLDERQAASLAQDSFTAIMTHVAQGRDSDFSQALLRLLSQLGEPALRKLLVRDMLAHREALAMPLEEVLPQLEAALDLSPGQGEQSDSELVAAALAAAPWDRVREAVALARTSDKKSDSDLADRLQAAIDSHDQGQADWASYGEAFLTKTDGTVRARLLTAVPAKRNPALLESLVAEAGRVFEIEALRVRLRLYRTNRDVRIVAIGWLKRIERAKRQDAALDYTDLITNARLLLQNTRRAWVQYKLDAHLRHVLVDEAQDTSEPQWQIVRSLTEDFFVGDSDESGIRTLFVVGDEKQSIYSFNGADRAAFADARRDYGAAATAGGAVWEDVPLALSFRSTSAVLSLVNQVFADEAIRPDISHEPFTQSPARIGDSGLVEVWPPLTKQKGEALDPWRLPLVRERQQSPSVRLAEQIAGRIRQWLDDKELLKARGRAVRAGDIMVLVPRRTAFFPQLVRALKDRQVPVAGVDRLVLTEQLAVQDVLALLNFLALPEDDLNLAALLKTPFIGLGEEALFDLCHARRGTVWQALLDRRLQPAYAAAIDWLEHWRVRVDYRRPHELLQEALAAPCPAYDAAGGGHEKEITGREAIWRRLGPDALDPLDELLAEAIAFEEREIATLQHFIAWITAADVEKKRELTGALDEVRIMTAHASKGLEAPIVFVVDLPRDPRAPQVLTDDDRASGGPPIFVPPDSKVEAVTGARKETFKAAQRAESRRLLYVALTRAEDRLYFCGAYPEKPPESAWLHLVQPAIEALGQAVPVAGETAEVWRYETPQLRPVTSEPVAADIASGVLPDWVQHRAPAEPALARPLAPSRASQPLVAVQSPADPDAGRRFLRGDLTHKLLQYLPDLPPAEREAAADRYLSRHADEAGEALRASIRGEVMSLLAHPDFAPIFGPGSQAEVPLVGIVGPEGGEQVISGQVDRLLVTDEAVLFIDYKTNRPPPSELPDVPEAYGRQLGYYAALLAQIYPDRPVRAALLWTDGPRLMELPPAFLARFLPGNDSAGAAAS